MQLCRKDVPAEAETARRWAFAIARTRADTTTSYRVVEWNTSAMRRVRELAAQVTFQGEPRARNYRQFSESEYNRIGRRLDFRD